MRKKDKIPITKTKTFYLCDNPRHEHLSHDQAARCVDWVLDILIDHAVVTSNLTADNHLVSVSEPLSKTEAKDGILLLLHSDGTIPDYQTRICLMTLLDEEVQHIIDNNLPTTNAIRKLAALRRRITNLEQALEYSKDLGH